MWLIIVCCVEILYDVKKTREDFRVYVIQPYGLNPTDKSQSATFSHSLNFIIPYVITPFLPTGFSRVSTRKTRQPEPSRPDPTRAHHIK
jgi:hypothetical protein